MIFRLEFAILTLESLLDLSRVLKCLRIPQIRMCICRCFIIIEYRRFLVVGNSNLKSFLLNHTSIYFCAADAVLNISVLALTVFLEGGALVTAGTSEKMLELLYFLRDKKYFIHLSCWYGLIISLLLWSRASCRSIYDIKETFTIRQDPFLIYVFIK